MCADNANGGMYAVSDPSGASYDPSQAPQQQVSPTPNGQMPPQSPAPQTPAAAQPNTPAATPTPGQGTFPTGEPQGPQTSQAPAAQSRTQKFLSRAREITDAIGGGDPYKTTIDPTTGETTRTPQPLSPRAISLSIIMSALEGGLSGGGAHGPDAIGQAAQAGLKQGQQIADQREANQANQDQQAQTDLKTRQQVFINNLQTRQLAQTLGRQSLDEAQKSVDADSAEWQAHQEDQSSILAQGLSHDDAYATLNRLGPTQAQVLITAARPRVDPKTGKPVFQLPNGQIVDQDTPGAYQAPDFTYAVVRPTAKHSITDNDGNLTPEVKDNVKYGFQQLPVSNNGKYPANYQIDGTAYQSGARGTQIAKALNVQINKERASVGLEPIDISKDTAQDSNVRNGMMMYNGVLSSSHGDHQKAYDAVLNSKYASAAGTIQNWFGGADAAKQLDAQRSSQEFDSGVLNNSIKLDNPQTIASARLSNNPKVRAAGDAQWKQNEADLLRQKGDEARQAANIEASKEITVARAKNAIAQQGGTENPNFNETPNAQGVRQNYLNSLPNRDQIQAIGEGRVSLPTGKADVATRAAVSRAYPNYDGSKFKTYQTAQTKATSGDTGKGIVALNTGIDHVAEMVDNATLGATLPGVGFIERGFGNTAANNFTTAQHAAAAEVNKAIKGNVLGIEEGRKALDDIQGWTPMSVKAKGVALINLLKDRLDEQQDNLNKASVTGVASFQLMTPKAQRSYDRIMGNTGTQSQGSSPSQQQTAPQNQVLPPGAEPAYNKQGQLAGYRLNGQVTRF